MLQKRGSDKKKQKILSLLIACSFAFSNISGMIYPSISYAAEEEKTENKDDDSLIKSPDGELFTETENDKKIKETATNANNLLEMKDLDDVKEKAEEKMDSLTNINDKNTRVSVNSLSSINKEIYDNVNNQQTNTTTQEDVQTYMVTNSKNESVTLRKNKCYGKTTQECTQVRSYPVYNSDGTYSGTNSYALNQVEWIADTGEQVTASMAAQAKSYERVMNSTTGATSLEDIQKAGDIASIQSISNLPSDATASERAMLYMMNKMAIENNKKVMEQDKKFDEALENIQEAREQATNERMAEEQEKRKTVTQDAASKKLYTVQLSPPVPTINDTVDIKAMLKTKSKKPNDESKYTITVRAHNYKTGKDETFPVRENVPFTLEPKEWVSAGVARTPGVRTVIVQYQYANNPEAVTTSFQYNLGQLQTSILPNGMAVENSVNALVSNVGITNYTKETSSVAGRVIDTEYDSKNGVCSMRITDSKTSDNDPNYAPAIITTTKLSEAECGSLAGKYVTMSKVMPNLDSSGNYVWEDVSEVGGYNFAMTESEYDALEAKANENLKEKQSQGYDIPTVTIDPETGKIYSALPGELGVNYVYFQGAGKSVSVYKDSDGSLRFAKPNGNAYSEAELSTLGLNLDNYNLATDENGLIYATDKNTGELATGTLNDKALINMSANTTTIYSANPNALNVESTVYSYNTQSNLFGVSANNIVNGAKGVVKGIGSITSLMGAHISTDMKASLDKNPMENQRKENIAKVLANECEYNLTVAQCARLSKGIADGTY